MEEDPDRIEVDELTMGKNIGHPLSPGFERIMDFLYEAAVGTKEIKSVILRVCTKSSTSRWADDQHEKCLNHKRHSTLPQASRTIDEDLRMAQLTNKFGTLTDIIARREQYDLEVKAEKEIEKKDKGSGAKKFEKLSPIIKNIMIMFTSVEGMTQDQVDELTPTENALSLLEVNSGPVIKELL